MITCIDHIIVGVSDLEAGMAQYRRLGFTVQPGGAQPGRGTHNAVAWNGRDYIELLAVRDEAEYRAASASGGAFARFVAAGGGIYAVVLASDDLVTDVAAMRARDATLGDPVEGSRLTPEGAVLRWKSAALGAVHGLPLLFVEHLTPLERRRPSVEPHPNAVSALERAYIVVDNAEAKAEELARILGVQQPPLQKGTVIMSYMAFSSWARRGWASCNLMPTVPLRGRSPAAGRVPSRRSIARAAWGPLHAGWPRRACRRRSGAFAIPANTRCSPRRPRPAAPTSVSLVPSNARASGPDVFPWLGGGLGGLHPSGARDLVFPEHQEYKYLF
jgi:hypothetical protein